MRTRLHALIVVSAFVAACSSNEANAPADAGPCPAGQHLMYVGPGCGGAAPSMCVDDDAIDDACLSTVCTCGGEEQADGCGKASVPFRNFGSCDESDAGYDARPDATTGDADATLGEDDATPPDGDELIG